MTTTYELWAGHDTFGRPVEVARRAGEDQWFARVWSSSRYGARFGRWAHHDPTWADKVPAPEMSSSTEPLAVAPFIAWGFQRLHRVDSATNPVTLRLPK